METLILTLSKLAPSVNRAYGNRRAGQKGRGRYVTPRLAKWRALAESEILPQIVGRARPIFTGPVDVVIATPRPVHLPRKDADGPVKATLDMLSTVGIYPDDLHQWVRSQKLEWIEPEAWGGRHGCSVSISSRPDAVTPTEARPAPTARARRSSPVTRKRLGSDARSGGSPEGSVEIVGGKLAEPVSVQPAATIPGHLYAPITRQRRARNTPSKGGARVMLPPGMTEAERKGVAKALRKMGCRLRPKQLVTGGGDNVR